ncbi:LacI family DNA-binding transcriptional regulator [Promicromonospora sp. NPDC019610]|uniref:LacI family DNA-binding transcriptional regulator n=1 Tax=Promicromonospora sp. NPDC019610 TaxID=3364405 RepID=UPI0037B5E17A
MTQRRRPTQVDIARAAGVSQATVSLVVSGGQASSQVAEQTRRAVLDAAAALGYTVNTAARSLKGGRNRMLGLYTFEPVFPVDQRDFYFPFLLGVEEATAEFGYDLLLFSSVGTGERRIYSGGINRLKVADGCVLLGRHIDRADLADLVREDFPFVFVGRRELPGAELSYVAPDYVGATRDMVRRLTDAGHRRLAYLRPADHQEPTRDREAGFRAGLADAGLPDQPVHEMPDDAVTTTDLLTDLLQRWRADGVTALLVEPSEDDQTVAALERVAAAAGLRIPEDLSVALLGDPAPSSSPSSAASAASAAVTPSGRDWTRFTLPREDMGRAAVGLLLEILDADDGPRRLSVACTPVDGDSVGSPP